MNFFFKQFNVNTITTYTTHNRSYYFVKSRHFHFFLLSHLQQQIRQHSSLNMWTIFDSSHIFHTVLSYHYIHSLSLYKTYNQNTPHMKPHLQFHLHVLRIFHATYQIPQPPHSPTCISLELSVSVKYFFPLYILTATSLILYDVPTTSSMLPPTVQLCTDQLLHSPA